MKKLLSILATVGLASTAGATVVACGQNKSEPKATTRDAIAPAPVKYWLTKDYDDGESLNDKDKDQLISQVMGAIKEANKDAVVNDDTFKLITEDIKMDTTSLKYEVKKTDPKEEKIGLNESKLEVKVNLHKRTTLVEAKGADVKLDVPNSEKGKPLAEEDKKALKIAIIEALNKANEDVIVAEDTWEVNLDGDVTPETTEITVKNKATESVGPKPGLKKGEVTVGLELTPPMSKVKAKTATVEMELTTGENEYVSSEDKVKLEEAIVEALNKANEDVIVEEGTWEVNLEPLLKDTSIGTLVTVHGTESTMEKNGLEDGAVIVALHLHAIKEKADARGVTTNFDLTETHLGEKLTTSDKNALKAQILAQLKDANDDANILEDTFGFDAFEELIVEKGKVFVGVTVKETESTTELHGLYSTPALITLTLNPINKEKVNAKLPEGPVQVNLMQTLEGDELTVEDNFLVRYSVAKALQKANVNAVVKPDTFVPELKNLNTADKKIEVLVTGTDSTVDKPGLEEGEITIDILLAPMKTVINPRGASVDFKLEETLFGDELTPKDKAGLEAKILEQLKEVHSKANFNDDTFEIDLTGFKVMVDDTLSVHVNTTAATNDKHGLFEKDVIVNIHLDLFIAELKDLVTENTELGYINDKTADDIVAAVEAKFPNAAGEIKVVEGSITDTQATIIAKEPQRYQGEVIVKFDLKQDLDNLLDGKADLGYFETADEAKAKAEEVIKDIEGLSEKITWEFNEEAKEIKVLANHESIKGEFIFTYDFKQNVGDLLKGQEDLGYFETADEAKAKAQEIVDAIDALKDKVKLDVNAETKQIKVTADDDSLKGEFVFNYNLSQNINDLLKDKEILEFYVDAPTAKNEVQKIVDGVEGLTGKVTVAESEDGVIKVTVNDEVEDLFGEVTFNYEISNKLDQLLPADLLDLGTLNAKDAKIKAQAIIDELGLTDMVELVDVDGENAFDVKILDEEVLEGTAQFTFTSEEFK